MDPADALPIQSISLSIMSKASHCKNAILAASKKKACKMDSDVGLCKNGKVPLFT